MSGAAQGMVGRFAPSPTGAMHLGNLRTALLAWLHSRSQGGRHLLRFEDLDVGRVRDWAYGVVRDDLRWLGLDWDEEVRQSGRLELYAAALEGLDGYLCTCTRRETLEAVQVSVGAPHGPEVIYNGRCRDLLNRDPVRPSAWRWRIPSGRVCAQDRWSGQTLCRELESEVGDMVLRRSDGVYAYHLAAVVDDAEMGVTDVLRGADLWPSTPRQVALQRALGLPTPRYWHVPLLLDYKGERLAKRGGAPSVRELRVGGRSAAELRSELARSLGWEVPDEVTLEELLTLYGQYGAAPSPAS